VAQERVSQSLGRVHHRGQGAPVLAEEAMGLAGRVAVDAEERARRHPALEIAVEQAEAAPAAGPLRRRRRSHPLADDKGRRACTGDGGGAEEVSP